MTTRSSLPKPARGRESFNLLRMLSRDVGTMSSAPDGGTRVTVLAKDGNPDT